MAALGNPDLVAYTDGSATDFTRRGGAGVVVIGEDQVLRRGAVPAGNRSRSYSAELAAMLEAVEWLAGQQEWTRAAVVTIVGLLWMPWRGTGTTAAPEEMAGHL